MIGVFLRGLFSSHGREELKTGDPVSPDDLRSLIKYQFVMRSDRNNVL
jgi:hypothetical protein